MPVGGQVVGPGVSRPGGGGGGGGISSWGQTSTAKFAGSGSPVGVVTPSAVGDVYVDDGPGGTSGQAFVDVPLDVMTDAAWDRANAQGTWVFNGDGSVSQTDPSATTEDNTIFTLAGVTGLAWDVQFDARIDSDDTLTEVGFFAEYPATQGAGIGGTGPYCSQTGSAVSGYNMSATGPNGGPVGAFTMVTGTFYTFRLTVSQGRMVYYAGPEGAPVFLGVDLEPRTGELLVVDSRIALYGSGPVTLKNFKLARIPLPASVV